LGEGVRVRTLEGSGVDLQGAVRWRWRLLLAVAGIVSVGVALYVGSMPDQYQATSVVAVVPREGVPFPGADFLTLSAPNFIAHATSADTLRSVAEQNETSLQVLDDAVHASVGLNSNTIVITVRSTSAPFAADVANDVATAMTLYSDGNGLLEAVRVADANVPTRPSLPMRGLGRVAGVLAGIATALAVVYVAERRRPHLGNPAAVPEIAGHSVLGTLPRSRRLKRGHHDGSGDPIAEAAIRLLGANFESAVGAGAGATLVTSSARGDGVSTVSMALAAAITQTGASVLLVRAEDTGTGRPPSSGAASEADPSSVLHDVAPSTEAPAIVALHGSEEASFVDTLARLVPEARKQFDVILIDAPPILEGSWARKVAGGASAIVFVVSAGQLVARVRRGALVLGSLGGKVAGIVGNRMPWWSSPP
jgi:Mrp family chromosome partitioning ATPase